MKVEYHKKFLKELAKIPAKQRKNIEQFVFNEILKANNIFEIGKIEKMKGYPCHYKIRFGVYRVGIKVINDKVIFERALNRKDIYHYFP